MKQLFIYKTYEEQIHWYERQVALQRSKRMEVPHDPLYPVQWHLHPIDGFPYVNINAEDVWTKLNITGKYSTGNLVIKCL
jgi:hypothetical protein